MGLVGYLVNKDFRCYVMLLIMYMPTVRVVSGGIPAIVYTSHAN